MDLVGLLETVVGLLLLFFLPGFTLARAVFPERRFRGPSGLRGALELFVLSFVLSVALTVLLGYVLLTAAPGGFSAGWTSPTLEGLLGGFAAVAFAVGAVQGAYARTPPAARRPEPETGETGAWELTEEFDRLRREQARVDALLRSSTGESTEASALRAERARLLEAERSLAARRELEYES